MAYIDKVYLTKEQYDIFKEWAKNRICVLYNGFESRVSNWLDKWDDNEIYSCLNTFMWQDRWLYHNCPLDFIQNRLLEVYEEDGIEELKAPIPSRGIIAKHFKVVEKPRFNLRSSDWWFITIYNDDPNWWWYNEDGDYWVRNDEYLPITSDTVCIKNFNLKKFYRKLIKWKLPVGLKIMVQGKYIGQTYIIDTYE